MMRRWIVVLASGSILLAIGAQPANPDGLAIVCPAEISEDGRTVVTNLFFNDFVVSELGYYYFDAVYGYDKLDGAGCFGDDSFVVQWGGLLDFAEPVAGQFTAIAKQYAFACAFPELAGCLGRSRTEGFNEVGLYVVQFRQPLLKLLADRCRTF
jgi:hypothetical protein